MIKIGICDDEQHIVSCLEKQIRELLCSWDIECEIIAFYSGEELLDYDELDNLGLAFLDIEMKDLDGIQIGELIRKRNQECKIIMATGMIERYKEAFHIQAFRFITKPFEDQEVEEALHSAIREQIGMQKIDVYANRISHSIPQKEIRYVTAYNGYCEFAAGNRTFRKDISMDKLDNELDERLFFRIHRKYIVNFMWIEKYQEDSIWIENREFKISRRSKKEFEKRYIEFDINYRRSM